MIVCDMCPDRTPAVFRQVIESIDPDQPKVDGEAFMVLVEALGYVSKANMRVTVALCEEHMRSMVGDPDVARATFQDAVRANRG